VMHGAAVLGDLEAALDRDGAAAGLDEQQRLGGHRVVQFGGMFRIVATHADDLAERVVNTGAIDILVLVAHENSLSVQTAKILPGFMMPLGSNTAFTAFMQAISASERL